MTKAHKKNQKIRQNQNNVKFHDFVSWLEENGFIHPTIDTPVNAQKKKDGTAKAYQVKQAIKIIDGE